MSTVSSSRAAGILRPAKRAGNRLYHTFTAPDNRANAVTIAVFGTLGVVALAGVLFAGAFHHLLTAGICWGICRASVAESSRNDR